MATLDLTPLRQAIASLENALGVRADAAWLDRQSEPVRQTLEAGVIQNFKFVYELTVKMLARELATEGASSASALGLNFRDTIRRAAEAGLIDDPRAWFGWRELRDITAHTYDLAKAKRVLDAAAAFARDARAVLASLEARHG